MQSLPCSPDHRGRGGGKRVHFRISGYSTSLVGSSYTLWFTNGMGYNLPPSVTSPFLPWMPINSGQLKAEGDPLVVSIDLPDGLVLPNCAVFVSVTSDLGRPLASSWITQFNID